MASVLGEFSRWGITLHNILIELYKDCFVTLCSLTLLSILGTHTYLKGLKISILMKESCSFYPFVTTCLPELTGNIFCTIKHLYTLVQNCDIIAFLYISC